MSWCRWESPCLGMVVNEADPGDLLNEECCKNGCPGSDLYIYEETTTCGDRRPTPDPFSGYDHDFLTRAFHDEDLLIAGDHPPEVLTEMYNHLLEHHSRGDHVRRSLLLEAWRWFADGKDESR